MSTQLPAELIGRLEMQVGPRFHLGETPQGGRRIDFLKEGGRFEGPRIHATVMAGVDHMLRLADGTMHPDVNVVLRTQDDALIYLTYRGKLVGAREVTQRAWEGRETDPKDYSIRTTVAFETAAPAYAWLNQATAVGYGERIVNADGTRAIRFDIYQLL